MFSELELELQIQRPGEVTKGMEPASEELRHGLQSLKIATDRDLTGCRARVRQLSRGLPTFDSVWIDALVSTGRLTPFQAKYFEQKQWQDLRLANDVVLCDQVSFDPVMPLFFGGNPESNEEFIVAKCDVNTVDAQSVTRRLEKLVSSENGSLKNHCQPIEFLFDDRSNVVHVLSPKVQGESLDRLLVRRGRFPEQVVRAVAVGLCEQLHNGLNGGLHGGLHGDIRLSNVWLTPQGDVALLNANVLNSISPQPTVHTELPRDVYDGLAPERFESKVEVNIATEMYALGCLLWQLLAGRPPHALADPLEKIAAHRQKPILGIRELAPETSAELALLIQSMTDRQARKRPMDFANVQEIFETGCRRPQERLKTFLVSFESAAPRQLGTSRQQKTLSQQIMPSMKITAVLMLTLIAGLVFWNRDQIGLPTLNQTEAAVENISPQEFEPVVVIPNVVVPDLEQKFLELPVPDSSGVVLLNQSGPYSLSSITRQGELTLRGSEGIRPTLIVTGSETSLSANQISFENVTLEFGRNGAEASTPPPKLHLIAEELRLSGCLVLDEGNLSAVTNSLINWSAITPLDQRSGRLLMTDTIIAIQRSFIEANTSLTTALLDNVNRHEGGPLLRLQGGVREGLRVPVVFNQCTVTGEAPLIAVSHLDIISSTGLLSIQGHNSIFAISSQTPLIAFTGTGVSNDWKDHVEVSAETLIVHQDAIIFGQRSSHEGDWASLPTDKTRVDGLLSGTFRLGPATQVEGSQLELRQVFAEDLPVRVSAELPGFDVVRFEAFDDSL